MYNDESDVDAAVSALNAIINKEYKGTFIKQGEDYVPAGWSPKYFDDYVNVEEIVMKNAKKLQVEFNEDSAKKTTKSYLSPSLVKKNHDLTTSTETICN